MYLGACNEARKTQCGASTCPAGQELVNGSCVPVCSGGQTRNAAGKCGCPAGTTLVNGKCSSSGGNFWEDVKRLVDGIVKTVKDQTNKVIDSIKNLYHKIKGETGECGGYYYNPRTECCKSGTKYTDKITNLSGCPGRYQKIPPTTNGCSVPWRGWVALQIKYHAVTRDNPVSTMTATSFRPACDVHDVCYGICYSGTDDPGYRDGCDQKFGQDMYNVCFNLPKAGLQHLQTRCRELQKQYVGQTKQFGEGNYIEAQRTSCKCCP